MTSPKTGPKIELRDTKELVNELAALLSLASAHVLGKSMEIFDTDSKFAVEIDGTPCRSYISDIKVGGLSGVQYVTVTSYPDDDDESNLEYELRPAKDGWVFTPGSLKLTPKD